MSLEKKDVVRSTQDKLLSADLIMLAFMPAQSFRFFLTVKWDGEVGMIISLRIFSSVSFFQMLIR